MSTKWPWVMLAEDFTLSLRKNRIPKGLISWRIGAVGNFNSHHIDFPGNTVYDTLRTEKEYLT